MSRMALNNLRIVRAVDGTLHDGTKPWSPLFDWLENKSGVGRTRLFFGLVCAIAAYMTTSGRGALLVGDLLGFAYPAYMTVALMLQPTAAATKSSRGHRGAADRPPIKASMRWLTYWLVFAAVQIAEHTLGDLLHAAVPFYGLIRIAVLVWCFAPIEMNGTAFVYTAVVRSHLAGRIVGADRGQ